MKKVFLLFVSIAMIGLTSCKEDEDKTPKVASVVNVKVTKAGKEKAGVTVCMFSEKKGFGTQLFQPIHADKKIITEGNGVASFDLQEVFNLDIIDTQTTFYFGIFTDGDSPKVLGKTAVTIKKGETKNVEIKL